MERSGKTGVVKCGYQLFLLLLLFVVLHHLIRSKDLSHKGKRLVLVSSHSPSTLIIKGKNGLSFFMTCAIYVLHIPSRK